MMRTLAVSALAPAESGALTRQDSTHAESKVVTVTLASARGLLLITLLAAPWAFGAVQVWAWATLTVLAFAALFLWAISNAAESTLRVVWSPLYVPAALFLALGVAQFYGHFTLDPVGTREALIKFATDLLFFFLAYQLMATAGGKLWRGFGLAVTIYAFALALFAIFQFFSSHGLLYWVMHTQGYVFGPYVNHNHYAGLMEMLIPIAAAYVLSRPAGQPRSALLGFMVLVPIASVLLSGSRGGMIALLVEAAIAAVLLWVCAPGQSRRGLATGAIGLTAAVLLFFWLAPGEVSKRLETAAGVVHTPDVTLGDRLVMARDSLRLWRDHPWIGSGLGSLETAYPPYQSFATDLFVDHAHNDYAEALAETGLAGGVLILAALSLFFTGAFGGLRRRLQHSSGLIQLGGAIGCCGLLIHSFVDFNLHIPANAAWFAVLVSLSTIGSDTRKVATT